MLAKQSLQRYALSIARALAPMIKTGNTVLLFRSADVLEVLSRDKDFTLSQVNGPHIGRHIGDFMLGMDDSPAYQRDVSIMRRAVHKGDVDRIRLFFRKKAEEKAKSFKGHFDLVDTFTRDIPYLMLGDYFGVPGPDKSSMLRWNRTIFWDIFLDLKQDPTIRKNALQSSEEMLGYLEKWIQEQKQQMQAGVLAADSMLSRLLTMQGGEQPAFTDTEIPGKISGTYMGFMEPTNKAMVNILRQFFARPEVLAQAREAAHADDAERMLGLALEAMRFHPNGPLLMRHSPQEQYIGGTDGRKKRRIPAGKTLYLMTQSAMFDPRAVEKPEAFLPHRPRETYLYFGYGLHTCFGNYINYVSIPEMLIALLKREHLQPVAKPVFEGPFPDSWKWQHR